MLLPTALLSNFHLLHRLLVVQSVPYWSHLNRHRSCTCIRASVLVTSEPSLGRYGREKYQEMESYERKKESAQKLFVGLVTSKGQSEESRREKKSERKCAEAAFTFLATQFDDVERPIGGK